MNNAAISIEQFMRSLEKIADKVNDRYNKAEVRELIDSEIEKVINNGGGGYTKAELDSLLQDKSDSNHTHPPQTTISGNAGTATALQTSRTFNVSGDVTGTAQSFNGSGDVTIPTKIASGSVNADKLANGVSPINPSFTSTTLDLNSVATTHAYISPHNWLGSTQYTKTPSGLATNEGYPWLLQNLVRNSNAVVQKIYVGHQHDLKNGVPREFIRSNNNNTNSWGPWHEILTVPSGTGTTWSRIPNDSIPISKISDMYSNTDPRANGTVAQGTSTRLSREDHVHPLQTTITGNAGTATTLQTSRSFNVSGDATGTAQSFNGGQNVTIPITIANNVVNYNKLAHGTTPSKPSVDFPSGAGTPLPTGTRDNMGFHGYMKENVTGFPPESATGAQGMIILPRGSAYTNTFRLAYDQTNRMFSANQTATWKEFVSVPTGTGTVWERIPNNAIPLSAVNMSSVSDISLTTLPYGISPMNRRTDYLTNTATALVSFGAGTHGFYGFNRNQDDTWSGMPRTVISGDCGMMILPRGTSSQTNTFRMIYDSVGRLFITTGTGSNPSWKQVMTVDASEPRVPAIENVRLRSLANDQIFDSSLPYPVSNEGPGVAASSDEVKKTLDARIGNMRIMTFRIALRNNARTGQTVINPLIALYETWTVEPSVTVSVYGLTVASEASAYVHYVYGNTIGLSWSKPQNNTNMSLHVQVIGYSRE